MKKSKVVSPQTPQERAATAAQNIAFEVDRMRKSIGKHLGDCQMHELDHEGMIEMLLWLLVSINHIAIYNGDDRC